MASYRWDAATQNWVAISAAPGAVTWDDVSNKPVQFPPTTHSHTFAQLPAGALGYALGTNAARPPGAGLVIWFAANEPPAMIENDFLIRNPLYG